MQYGTSGIIVGYMQRTGEPAGERHCQAPGRVTRILKLNLEKHRELMDVMK